MEQTKLHKFQHQHSHIVQVYETDLMRVVHHSNYPRFLEEARVKWAHSCGLINYQQPETAAHFAVIELNLSYKKPAFFGDELSISLQVRREGRIKIEFQYLIINHKNELILKATSIHACLDQALSLRKIPQDIIKQLEKEPWIET